MTHVLIALVRAPYRDVVSFAPNQNLRCPNEQLQRGLTTAWEVGMARRKRKGPLDDLFAIAAQLPWQVSHLGGMSPEQFKIAHKATRKRVH